ncbi:MAG: outer membrane beta-barrel protein [Gemmatimonadota bacterium]|jgi:hypothetical protein
MRRVVPLLVGALSLMMAPMAQAQVRFGAYGGLVRSGFSGDAPKDTEYRHRTGPVIGALFEIPVAENVRISVQPSWLKRGTKIAVNVQGEDERQDSLSLGLSYVSVPILMKIETAGGRIFVSTGAEAGVLLDATLSPVQGGGEGEDVGRLFRDLDLAVDFGVGGQFPIGLPTLTAEVRYTQSLTDISQVEVDVGAEERVPARVRSSGFAILAGIWIPLGGGD